MNKRIIIWNTDIVNLIEGTGGVGGLTVQLYFWARTFAANGWKTYSFTLQQGKILEDIYFIHYFKYKRLDLFFEPIITFSKLISIRPSLVIFRGSDRKLLWLSLFSKFLGIKCVMFGASDVNFIPGKDWTAGKKMYTYMYRHSLKFVSHFVTQNREQQGKLQSNYNRTSLIIPNIWLNLADTNTAEKEFDVLWVANLRKLKRPEWFINLAKELPTYRFAMLGGVYNGDTDYYETVKQSALGLNNLSFLGGKPFFEANGMFAKTKLLVCTSEYEGFPNTFLQAWVNNVPVISSVNPNNLLDGRSLGMEVHSESELYECVSDLLKDEEKQKRMSGSITSYFGKNHSAENAYQLLMSYLRI